MSNLTPEELARKADEQGTFSFVERLRGRNYAKDEFDVYLDEDLGYKIQRLEEAYNSENTPKEMKEEIFSQIHAVREQLDKSRYTIHVEGISNERYDELVDLAAEDFPYEYEDYQDPWSGKRKRDIIPDNGRNELFTNMLWAEVIRKIVDADGNVDDAVTSETIATIRAVAPLGAIMRIAEAVEKIRMASDWIEYLEDEDFFPKP